MNILTVTLNPCLDKTVKVEKLNISGLSRAEIEKVDFGGKGINVSKILKNFGTDSISTGIMPMGNSRPVFDYMAKKEIENDYVISNGFLRTNLKVLDLSTNEITEINEKGPEIEEKYINDFADKFTRLSAMCEYVVISGSLPRGFSEDFYAKLVEIASVSSKVILDCDGVQLKNAIEKKPYMIKPNIYEFSGLMGREYKTDEEIAEDMLKLNKEIPYIIVSMGEDGAMFCFEGQVIKTTPFEIEFGSSVCAGDSMVGAMVYADINGFDYEKTVKFATACGTLTASKKGSEVCELQEALENMDRIKVKKVK